MNSQLSFLLVAALLIETSLMVTPGSVMAQNVAVSITADQVDVAIEKGVKYLWSQQRPNGMFGSFDPAHPSKDYRHPGDNEVMAMITMVYAGEPMTKPEMQKGLKTLMELNLGSTYTLGFRLVTLAELYRHADAKAKPGLRQAMKQDADKLASYQIDNGGWEYGLWPANHYFWDFSNTQIAVLGLQQAASCGVEVKAEVFTKALELYLAKQHPDGGWAYGRPSVPDTASYGSMTAAGVASLFLIRDLLNPGAGCPCKGDVSSGRHNPKTDEAIKHGLRWLGQKFTATTNPDISPGAPYTYYWLYAVERVAIASGFKYLGKHNWYTEGAATILASQNANGSFGRDVPETALALLFLIKGRGPILLNKLEFDGEWDRHAHDAANLAEYVGNLKEQRFNWQIINLDVPVEEMHDAPILYISAESALKLTDEQKKKLRAFTDSGGTILFEASCGNRAADLAWKLSCKEIWPEWELSPIDKDHPLWTADAKIVANRPFLMTASDGVRTFLFVSGHDISCAWNTMGVTKNQSVFDLGGNLYAYTTDRGKLRAKLAARESGPGKKYEAEAVSHGALAALTVARVKHGGDWYVARNYHPWEQLAGLFHSQADSPATLKITEATPVAPGEAIPAGTNILYLSGRTGCDLGANGGGGKWLKDFTASGGFIFAEAVLGDKRFDETVRPALQSAGFTLKPLPTDHPLLTGQMANGAKGYNVTKVGYSFALRSDRVGQSAPLLEGLFLGEKLVGVYSPYDILFSATGSAAFGNRGYAAEDARALAMNVMLMASSR